MRIDLGWRDSADHLLLRAAFDDWAVCHGHWDGYVCKTIKTGLPAVDIEEALTDLYLGIETSTVPMYQAELCEAHKRGRLVCSEALFVGLGIVIGKNTANV